MRSGNIFHTVLWLIASLLIYSSELFALAPDATTDKDHAKLKPNGSFTWIESRHASYIAAPITTMPSPQDKSPNTISFGKQLKWHDGTVCNNWELKANHIYCAFLEDPLLTDTQLRSNQSNSKNRILNQGYEVICEGITIGSMTDIDGRILVIPIHNSTFNGLFEKTIDEDVMLEMARVLNKRNITTIAPDKITQHDFREAVSAYVSDMGGFNIRFYRSPITWAVMDELVEKHELRKELGLHVEE